ncbi:hypothetical protein MMPV_004827 [Pyropia vietnamensis]
MLGGVGGASARSGGSGRRGGAPSPARHPLDDLAAAWGSAASGGSGGGSGGGRRGPPRSSGRRTATAAPVYADGGSSVGEDDADWDEVAEVDLRGEGGDNWGGAAGGDPLHGATAAAAAATAAASAATRAATEAMAAHATSAAAAAAAAPAVTASSSPFRRRQHPIGAGALGARRRPAGAAPRQPVYASPSPASEAALRNLLVTGLAAFAGLLFLRWALAAGLLATTFLLPAWRTFQLAEAEREVGPAAAADPTDADTVALAAAVTAAQRRWGAYWVLAAVGVTADALVLAPARGWVLYSAALLAAVGWLTRGDAAGAEVVYGGLVRPLLVRWEGRIAAAIAAVGGVIDRGGKEALVRVSAVVTPYARALEEAGRGAAQQLHIEQ